MPAGPDEPSIVTRAPYGTLPDGTLVERFTLRNTRGTTAEVITYGARLIALDVAGRDGVQANVVLGCSGLDDYLGKGAYFGAVIGRYANRIARGRFTVAGVEHRLACNNPPNALHGGPGGFHARIWQARTVPSGIELTRVSLDGEEGYPGTLEVSIVYTLTADDRLVLDCRAATDRATVINLAGHAFFNLAGEGTGDVYAHELAIMADAFTPIDATLIPTGEIRPVAGTPFDFRSPTPIGARIRDPDPQIGLARGFDHNFVLRPGPPGQPRLAARVAEPASGRVLEVWTTEPALQFYSGNFLDATLRGRTGRSYRQSDGFCLEAQRFPDAPNHHGFPTAVLHPHETFRSTTIYRFFAIGSADA